MGPPKKKPPRRGVDERVRQENHFEYRWNSTEGHWYLFNPYTGETILGDNVETLDRSQSMWAPPDKFASKEAYSLQLLPQYYLSRRWGRRDFNWNGNCFLKLEGGCFLRITLILSPLNSFASFAALMLGVMSYKIMPEPFEKVLSKIKDLN